VLDVAEGPPIPSTSAVLDAAQAPSATPAAIARRVDGLAGRNGRCAMFASRRVLAAI
jgi:hypothetical protein